MSIDLDCCHPDLRIGQRRLARHLRSILAELGHPRGYVDVRLTTDADIRELNRQYRKVDAVTDVLSFPLADAHDPDVPVELLGDIVISLDTAQRQARAVREAVRSGADPADVKRYRLTEEVLFLATHGLLHLLGHDHAKRRQAEDMEALERRFMATVTPLDVHLCDRTAHGVARKAKSRE
jgi:probable rRNA maturation factor